MRARQPCVISGLIHMQARRPCQRIEQRTLLSTLFADGGLKRALDSRRSPRTAPGRTLTFPSPGQPLRAIEFLQCRFRLECVGLAGEGLCAKHANRRVGACEFRPFTAAVSGKSGCDVGRDAGVRPAIAAHEQIEPPALGHADRLPTQAVRSEKPWRPESPPRPLQVPPRQ